MVITARNVIGDIISPFSIPAPVKEFCSNLVIEELIPLQDGLAHSLIRVDVSMIKSGKIYSDEITAFDYRHFTLLILVSLSCGCTTSCFMYKYLLAADIRAE